VDTTARALNPRGTEVLAAVADATVKLYAESLAVQARIDMDAILTTVTSTISELIPATCMAVLMKADPDTSRVVFADHTNPAMALYLETYVAALLRPGEAPTAGISQGVIESGTPKFVSKIPVQSLRSMLSVFGQTYTSEHAMPMAVELISMLVVPMRSGPAIVGALGLTDWTGGDAVNEDDIGWMQRVADRVGITIDNAQLRNKALDRVDRITALSDVALAMTSSQDLRLTLKLILERVVGALHVEAADVLLLDDENKMVFVAASAGFHLAPSSEFRFPFPPDMAKRSLFERRIDSPAPVEWMGQHRRSILAREGLNTYTAIPMAVGERVVGAFEVFSRGQQDADPEWLTFLDAMASHAAIAVDHAALHDELRRIGGAPVASRLPAPTLSEREREILSLVVEGAGNRDISEKLHLSQNTIKFHIRQLLDKADVANRTELAAKALQRRWLQS